VNVTVVIPVFNEERHVGEAIRAVEAAASRTPALAVDVIVIDDGSTDGTVQAAESTADSLPIRVISQANRGRFVARRTGLEAARGELVLLLDGRVLLDVGALEFVEPRLRHGERVWNGHCDIQTDHSPFGLFWRAVTEVAFAEYFSNPRTTSFDASRFDRFPKGTTCFLAPRATLLEAFASFRSSYADLRHANDDTPVIRWIAERSPVHISPSFRCMYRPRTTLRAFLRHAFHRGTVFLDGHGRRGSRFLPLVIAVYPLSVACIALSVRRPGAVPLLAGGFGAAAAAVAAFKQRPAAEVATIGLLAPAYAVAHGAGMWRGLLLRTHKLLA
jgi:glycosyltransferase involved in cell wall biosynthesis